MYTCGAAKMRISTRILYSNVGVLKALFFLLSGIIALIMGIVFNKVVYLIFTVVCIFSFIISWLRAFERLFDRCVDVQVKQIIRTSPDILVGSSFGGFIALELVKRKIWRGPVLLLSPAHDILSLFTRFRMYDMGDVVFANKILSVVGKQDHISYIYSRRDRIKRFFSDIKIWVVNDDHRLGNVFNEESAREMIEQLR